MGSLRDPSWPLVGTEELARLDASLLAERRREVARTGGERALAGSPSARAALAADWAAVAPETGDPAGAPQPLRVAPPAP